MTNIIDSCVYTIFSHQMTIRYESMFSKYVFSCLSTLFKTTLKDVYP